MLHLNFTIFPALNTARLVLRQLVADDAEQLHHLRSDPEVNRYLDRPKSNNINEASAFITKIHNFIANHQSLYWVITLAGDDTLIGTICLWNFDMENETIELGYELTTAAQGKGIMAEAVTKVIEYGFQQLNAKAITAFPSANNVRSVALLKKLGFTIDDTLQTEVHNNVDNMQHYILRHPA